MKLGHWIAAPRDTGDLAINFVYDYAPEKAIKKATVYATAMGVYNFKLNGKKVGKGVLAPGWTSYTYRVLYQTYDVTDLLCASNKFEFGVGKGWAVGAVGYTHVQHLGAEQISFTACIEIEYADGSVEEIVTGENWDVYTTQITAPDLYKGETVDLTAPIEYVGKAKSVKIDTAIVEQMGEWIVENERLAPAEIIRTPKGEFVVDFGQNMTGYVEVKIKAKRGDRIVMHHAEVLDKDGNFYNANYRTAKNENIYICSGDEDVFKPTYTFQGFRYIKLAEYPFETVDTNSLRAIVVHSEMKRTGHYSCGNEKINQLYHNIIWGHKSNYLDIPTDCPQRDERLGWTGDTQVFCRTAAINYDVEKFFEKWMGDVALEQEENGAVCGVVPSAYRGRTSRISAGWGDVACIAPWQLYLAYGNKEDLKTWFPVMKKWVGHLRSAGPEEYLWLGGLHYGDWLAMDDGQDSYVGATSNDLIASAFFAYSTSLVIKAGEALGENVDEYKALHANIVKAFRAYFMENGMPKESFPYTEFVDPYRGGKGQPIDTTRLGMTQTALVLILHFGLCTDEERPALAAKLCEMIRDNGNRMTTGFLGTPYILHVLSDNGYTDLAYELLFQEQNPSWLYSVCHGATTMWEHWNSIKEDGSFWSTDMNSFNHYAYGAVYDWIFGVSSGIKTVEDAPAYKKIAIAPHPDKRLGYADAQIESRQGKVRSYWYYKGDKVYYEFEVPAGATAEITLPSGYTTTVGEGIHHFAE